jgi:cobalt-zinc-cadmium efflux system membrane fusion protein
MNHLNRYYIVTIIFTLTFLMQACTHDHDPNSNHSHDTEAQDVHGHNSDEDADPDHEDGLHLSKAQMKTIDLQFGDFSQLKISDYINATGTLGLPPNAYASVSAKAPGFIKGSNKYVEGSYVKKGTIMGYIESPEFITLQQEYLETQAEIVFLSQDLERQRALVDANAGITKNVQKLESQLAVREIKLKGKAKYLNYLGISTSELSADNLRQRIVIVAPMSGYLTRIQMHNGLYVEPNKELMEIVNEEHLHLELDVFEQDIARVKKDQKISYIVPALGHQQFSGEVHIIGKEFNTENKTVRVHGHLEKERPTFIKDLFIEAKIWVNDNTVAALPEEAVIKDGLMSYIYVGTNSPETDEIEFSKIMVIPGTKSEGFVSVKLLDEIPVGMDIVVKGAYYVYAQSKIGSLTHEH